MAKLNRRTVLTGGLAVTGTMLLTPRRVGATTPSAKIHERKVISWQPELYHGWPTITRRKNGQLLLVCSGGRETHVCPFGQVVLMRSKDEGDHWTWPEVVIDTPIDDRDAGVLETARGTILITTFTSLAYESILNKALKISAGGKGAWPNDRLARWQAAHQRLSAAERKAALGVFMIRSSDGGTTWSQRYDCKVDSPHGPIQLADGRILYAGVDLWRQGRRVGVCQSTDDGRTWQWLAELPVREGDRSASYHELHAVETADNRIILQIRNHNPKNSGETLQCESSDGGKTWSRPRGIGVWGVPSHLLRLKDSRLVMTYGHRRAPRGNQARVSEDHGRTWSDPILVSSDGITSDLGYPGTVQLSDGSLLSVWYERMRKSPRAVLRQARWSL